MQGRIHSLESFGTVDGPGTRVDRFVPRRPSSRAYCHNPDTWAMTGGTMMEPEEIFEQYQRNKEKYKMPKEKFLKILVKSFNFKKLVSLKLVTQNICCFTAKLFLPFTVKL